MEWLEKSIACESLYIQGGKQSKILNYKINNYKNQSKPIKIAKF